MYDLGVMQGRLLPRYRNRYQAFPAGYWEAEFHIARELGFRKIEFILDFDTSNQNPLFFADGRRRLRELIAETGVTVHSVCADYFMKAPLHSRARNESLQVLKNLIQAAGELPIRGIVIPCLKESGIKTEADRKMVVEAVKEVLPEAEQSGVHINFETDLPPDPFAEFLGAFSSSLVGANYDTGNSAWLGFDPVEEFAAYGEQISDVHIKDRELSGDTVVLGTGATKFESVFRQLAKCNFRGNLILQAVRANQYQDELPLVIQQADFAQEYVSEHLADREDWSS